MVQILTIWSSKLFLIETRINFDNFIFSMSLLCQNGLTNNAKMRFIHSCDDLIFYNTAFGVTWF